MIMRFVFSVSVFAILFTGNTHCWNYENYNGWPSICFTGKRQSPIEIWKNSAKRNFIPPLYFQNYRNNFQAALENNGHTVEIHLIPEEHEEVPRLLGGNNIGEYILHNIHFHWDSEHTINGIRFPLEGHYVHYKKAYGDLNNAVKHEDGIIVLGVMFKVIRRDNKKLRNVMDATKTVSTKLRVPSRINGGIQVADILPKNTQRFYTYAGSLTTPNCSESVKWIVFEDAMPVGKDQLKLFRNITTDTGEVLKSNFRSLQKLNNRDVFYSQCDID